jgi:hypothetical protein
MAVPGPQGPTALVHDDDLRQSGEGEALRRAPTRDREVTAAHPLSSRRPFTAVIVF